MSWGRRRGGAGPTWPQQLRPGAGAQDAPGLQAAAFLQHSPGQAAQRSIQPGGFPGGGARGRPCQRSALREGKGPSLRRAPPRALLPARSSPRPELTEPDSEAPGTHPSGSGPAWEDFAGPEAAGACSSRRAAASAEQKEAHCSRRAPSSRRTSVSWRLRLAAYGPARRPLRPASCSAALAAASAAWGQTSAAGLPAGPRTPGPAAARGPAPGGGSGAFWARPAAVAKGREILRGGAWGPRAPGLGRGTPCARGPRGAGLRAPRGSHLGTGSRWEGVSTARPVAAPSGGSPEAGQLRLGCDAQPPTAAAENGLPSRV